MRLIGIVLVVWLLCTFLNAGFILRDEQARCKDIDCSIRWYRRDLAFAIGVSLLPIIWLITPFVTGFYENGWGFQRADELHNQKRD